jgi:hypothetical protein
MLMYAWLTIRINGALALSQATRVRGSIIEVKGTLQYANRPVPFVVTIRKTAEAHLVDCALKVEGSSLTTR